MFHPHVWHLFKGVTYTDGISILAVCKTIEVKPTKSKAGQKCKHIEPEQLQQLQPVTQQARLAAQQLSQEQNTEPVQLEQQADCAYISDLSQATLQGMTRCCVLVDPGHQDLLFMMHEKSTVEEKDVYRYKRSQQCKETCVTKHQKILQDKKKADDEDITALEHTLSASSFIKPDLDLY
ncbi:hypothetical protein GGH96_004291 [Coemansia sp. RSA 1972]|nr:hypothetical protein GGH96_004291 [Coemansia sp. RSA 1972]